MFFRMALIALSLMGVCSSAVAETYERNESVFTRAVITNKIADFWSPGESNAVRGTLTFRDGAQANLYHAADVRVGKGIIQLGEARFIQRNVKILDVNVSYPIASKRRPDIEFYFPFHPDFTGPKAQRLLSELGDFSSANLFINPERSNEDGFAAILPVGRSLLMVSYDFVFTNSQNTDAFALVTVQVWEPAGLGLDLSDTQEPAENLDDGLVFSEEEALEILADEQNPDPINPIPLADNTEEDDGLNFSDEDVLTPDGEDGLDVSDSDTLDDQEEQLDETGLVFTPEEAGALGDDEEISGDADGLRFSEEDIDDGAQNSTADDPWTRPLNDEQRAAADQEFETVKSCISNTSPCPAYIDADAARAGYTTDADASEETLRDIILDEILGADPEKEEKLKAIRDKIDGADDDSTTDMSEDSNAENTLEFTEEEARALFGEDKGLEFTADEVQANEE